jgi:hypothetical protein
MLYAMLSAKLPDSSGVKDIITYTAAKQKAARAERLLVCAGRASLSQQPQAEVDDAVHEVVARLARIMLRPAKNGAEHQHGTERPIDAEVQIAGGEAGEEVLKVGH